MIESELERLYSYACSRYSAGDLIEAFDCFKEAHDRGHVGATVELGILYSDDSFVGHDYEKAFYYLQPAKERGDTLAGAMLDIIQRHIDECI